MPKKRSPRSAEQYAAAPSPGNGVEVLTERDKAIIKQTWKLVVPIGETAADLFYKRLFTLEPRYRSLFKGDFEAQKRKLITMLAFIVKSLDWDPKEWQLDVDAASDLFLVIMALGRRHSELYAVPDQSYQTVGEALLWTLDYGLGEAFTPEARAAWTRVYTVLAGAMKLGRFASDAGTPILPKDWEELTA